MADETARETGTEDKVVEVEAAAEGEAMIPITSRQIRAALMIQPVTLLTVLPFGLINAYGYPRVGGAGLSWAHVGWGALGWYVALLLRAPVVGIAQALKLDPKTMQMVAVLASGPCEEGIRAIALWAWPGQHDFHSAFSLGLGWAGIEVVFTVIQALVMINLLGKNDEKSREARQKMIDFVGRDTSQDSPWWACLERVSATMGHIWFTRCTPPWSSRWPSCTLAKTGAWCPRSEGLALRGSSVPFSPCLPRLFSQSSSPRALRLELRGGGKGPRVLRLYSSR